MGPWMNRYPLQCLPFPQKDYKNSAVFVVILAFASPSAPVVKNGVDSSRGLTEGISIRPSGPVSRAHSMCPTVDRSSLACLSTH